MVAIKWQFPNVIDISRDTTPLIPDLKELGVQTVFRYYAHRDDQWAGKLISKTEADMLHNHGFSIGVVYQYHNNNIDSFHKSRAEVDANHSLEFASNTIEQPKGSAIYFGVDGDWPATNDISQIIEYFEEINRIFADAGNIYRIGVYGSGKTCEELRNRSLAELFWLPLSTGWTGSRDFYNDVDSSGSKKWHMYQNSHSAELGGIKFDTNILSKDELDIGAFTATNAVTTKQNENVRLVRRFVTASSLNIRESRSSDSAKKVRKLRRRNNIGILDEKDGWASVVLDESGKTAGYCSVNYLTDLSKMP